MPSSGRFESASVAGNWYTQNGAHGRIWRGPLCLFTHHSLYWLCGRITDLIGQRVKRAKNRFWRTTSELSYHWPHTMLIIINILIFLICSLDLSWRIHFGIFKYNWIRRWNILIGRPIKASRVCLNCFSYSITLERFYFSNASKQYITLIGTPSAF